MRLRLGVTTVESALILTTLLFILMSLLDLGLCAFRFNALGSAAHRVARGLSIRGTLAPVGITPLGPDPYAGTAADSSDIVASLNGLVPTMDPIDVQVIATWPDGENRPRDRVEVQVQYVHQPISPVLLPWGPLTLTAESAARIIN